MAEENVNELFVGLLLGLHSTAWAQLGKVMHPLTGKVERDLEAAKQTIDLLGAIETRTRGNLAGEEERLLARLLLELRMNYVEELKRGEREKMTAAAAGEPPAAGEQRDPQAEPPAAQPGPSPTATEASRDPGNRGSP